MAEGPRLRCAAESRARGEALIGTASRVQRWLVIEQPGAWGREALVESELDREVATALQGAARRHRVRVLLARPAGDRSRAGDRRVFLAHSGRERCWVEQVDLPRADAAALLDIDLGTLAFPDPPGVGRSGPDGLAFVCTNGKHDPCCADHGRPVVRALVAAGTPDVWEVSHIGGDRFAANVLFLPDGTYYGRVEPEWAADLVTRHRTGVIDLDRYRGRSALPPLVQVAEAHARRHLGERRITGMTVLATEPHDDRIATVVLEQRGGATVEVVVRRDTAPAVQLTCHVATTHAPPDYRLVDLRLL